jgi:hypothetical protein
MNAHTPGKEVGNFWRILIIPEFFVWRVKRRSAANRQKYLAYEIDYIIGLLLSTFNLILSVSEDALEFSYFTPFEITTICNSYQPLRISYHDYQMAHHRVTYCYFRPNVDSFHLF